MNQIIIIIETLYTAFVVITSLFIFSRLQKMHRFSRYKGLKFLSSAFFLFAMGFLVRYTIMLSKITLNSFSTISEFGIMTMLMEILLITPGLFILYSFIWKKIEKNKYSNKPSFSIIMIYLIAIIISYIDMIIQNFYVMYSSQILLFSISAIFAYKRYKKTPNNYIQLYFITMILFAIVWTINFIAQYTIDAIPFIRFYAYLFTASGFLILFYITKKLTRDFR